MLLIRIFFLDPVVKPRDDNVEQ
ncbi:MAG: palindromic element RPE4 domain-containing protein [Rickettsia sp.]